MKVSCDFKRFAMSYNVNVEKVDRNTKQLDCGNNKQSQS